MKLTGTIIMLYKDKSLLSFGVYIPCGDEVMCPPLEVEAPGSLGCKAKSA